MEFRRNTLVALVALGLMAGGLRFFRLGNYPFGGDELSTIAETRSLLEKHDGPLTSQLDRLPRLIPLAYLTHALGYRLFGRDEFGSRVLMATLGTAGVLIVFLGLIPVFDRWTATTTALLITVWPEHLFQSQQNRFYITAWFFSTLCMLLGAQAMQRRSAVWMLWACLAAMAAVLTHTILVLLLPGLFIGVCAAAWCERRPLPWRVLLVLVVCGLATLGLLVIFLLPLASGWNAGDSTWGYSPARSMLGSVNVIGWPVFLLAGLGAVRLICRHPSQGGYWLTWAATFVGAGATLPLFVVYHPGYVFPLSTGMIVLAGCAVAGLTDAPRPLGNWWAYSLVGFFVALQFPSVVSHYRDGSRRITGRQHDISPSTGYRVIAWPQCSLASSGDTPSWTAR